MIDFEYLEVLKAPKAIDCIYSGSETEIALRNKYISFDLEKSKKTPITITSF